MLGRISLRVQRLLSTCNGPRQSCDGACEDMHRRTAVGHCSHLGIEDCEDVMLLARQHKGVREIARTIGRDRPAVSRELARARQIQERLGIPACFCAPRHPWEKGTNENTNGLLRDFFPKGRGLDGATDAEVSAAYAMLS